MSDYDDPSESIYEYQPFSQSAYETYSYDEDEVENTKKDKKKKDKKQGKKASGKSPTTYGGDDGMGNVPLNSSVEDELRAKALELARKEAELEQREMDIANREVDNEFQEVLEVKKNWPKCYPILDHSYKDIPTTKRKILAWVGYILWYVYLGTLLFNILCSLITLFLGPIPQSEDLFRKLRYVFFSVLVFLIAIPGHFVLSYWPLYKAMRYGTLPRYIIFFVGYAIPILVLLFSIIGFYDYGFGGLYVLIAYWPTVAGSSDNPDYKVFLVMLILTMLWVALLIAFSVIYIIVIITFRKQKHTLKDVQQLAKDSTRDAVSAVTTKFGQVAVDHALGRNSV